MITHKQFNSNRILTPHFLIILRFLRFESLGNISIVYYRILRLLNTFNSLSLNKVTPKINLILISQRVGYLVGNFNYSTINFITEFWASDNSFRLLNIGNPCAWWASKFKNLKANTDYLIANSSYQIFK